MKSLEHRPRNVLLLLYHWLCVGFFLGTLTLMGPVRWLANYSRSHDWSESRERTLVFACIGVLVAVSAICARMLAARTTTAGSTRVRAALMAAPFSLFAISLWCWMTPSMMIERNMRETFAVVSETEFVFGPYPDKERLAALRKQHYTAVISLLSPAVVPFEPVLINREAALAKEAGIELIHMPMLPWVSTNDQIRDQIRTIVQRPGAKYYVHCYLGKDRVNVFKRILASMSPDVKLTSLQPDSIRTLYEIDRFERGRITILDSNVFFMPYPTDEEFFGYVLNGSIRTLVGLLNPANPEDLPWITREKTIAEQHHLTFVNYPWKTLGENRKREVMKELMTLGKPVAIHAFDSSAPECTEFINLYHSMRGRPVPALPKRGQDLRNEYDAAYDRRDDGRDQDGSRGNVLDCACRRMNTR
jgi:hypothetical protein